MPCYRVCYRLSRNPPRHGEHHLVQEAGVSLRRHDRRVPQQLLKGGEATTPFDPATSELVAQLMRVKPPRLAQDPHAGVELPRVR